MLSLSISPFWSKQIESNHRRSQIAFFLLFLQEQQQVRTETWVHSTDAPMHSQQEQAPPLQGRLLYKYEINRERIHKAEPSHVGLGAVLITT